MREINRVVDSACMANGLVVENERLAREAFPDFASKAALRRRFSVAQSISPEPF
jgi:hypothetical protein